MIGPTWHAILSPAEQDCVRSLLADAERADGVAPVGEQVVRDLAAQRSRHALVHDPARTLVGYLSLAPDGTAELAVHPAARRRGVGTALVTAALDQAGDALRIWAHGTLPAAAALAGKSGLRPVRELIQMRRHLSDLPKSIVARGVSIRHYEGDADNAELLRVNNAAFSWHPEQGGWTERDIVGRTGEPWFDPGGLFLAFDDDSGLLSGFHWTKVHDEGLGEVYVLGVDPGAQGRGLGRALTQRGLEHLADRLGRESVVMLYVESDNVAAITTYESLGFRRYSVDTGYAPV